MLIRTWLSRPRATTWSFRPRTTTWLTTSGQNNRKSIIAARQSSDSKINTNRGSNNRPIKYFKLYTLSNSHENEGAFPYFNVNKNYWPWRSRPRPRSGHSAAGPQHIPYLVLTRFCLFLGKLTKFWERYIELTHISRRCKWVTPVDGEFSTPSPGELIPRTVVQLLQHSSSFFYLLIIP